MMSTRRSVTVGSFEPVWPIGSCRIISRVMPSASSWSVTIELRVCARYLFVSAVPVALARAWTTIRLRAHFPGALCRVGNDCLCFVREESR